MRSTITALSAFALLTTAIVSGQSGTALGGTVPRTPWGDPDLQGTWSSESELSVPFERATQYGDRKFLTDAEFAERRKQTTTQLQSDLAEFEVFTADTRNAGAVGSATSPPPHWLERGKTSRRTSLVIDPPDGRIPPLTAEAQKRGPGGGRGTFGGGSVNSAQGRSLGGRWISRGLPGASVRSAHAA